MNLQAPYEGMIGIREITDHVRREISSRNEKFSDAEVLDLIEDYVLYGSPLRNSSYKKKAELVTGVFNATRKELGLLQPLADDEDVSEIMVNGTDYIFAERNGKVEKTGLRFETAEELEEVIRRLAGKVQREINDLNPILDARMSDGSRVHAVNKNVAINGPILSIRRFPKQNITMEQLLESGSISIEGADFLKKMVKAGYNIFISGGTSSGKTTMLNALTAFIPKDERLVVIEDSAELKIQGIENIVRMECRRANVAGKGEVDIRQLIKASLRMRPDRIIVGEVRGAEVMDMLQAMNTGHDGSLSTGHANSSAGMLSRLEAMYLSLESYPVDSVRRQIVEAIDLIVHMGRMNDGSRKVLEIAEVLGCEEGRYNLNPMFLYSKEAGLVKTGNKLHLTVKAERQGLIV